MKTAESWNELIVLTSTGNDVEQRNLITIEKIQLDAFKAGMRMAARIAYDNMDNPRPFRLWRLPELVIRYVVTCLAVAFGWDDSA